MAWSSHHDQLRADVLRWVELALVQNRELLQSSPAQVLADVYLAGRERGYEVGCEAAIYDERIAEIAAPLLAQSIASLAGLGQGMSPEIGLAFTERAIMMARGLVAVAQKKREEELKVTSRSDRLQALIGEAYAKLEPSYTAVHGKRDPESIEFADLMARLCRELA